MWPHRIKALLISLLVFPTCPAIAVLAYAQNGSQPDPGSVGTPSPAAAESPTSSAEPNPSSEQDRSASAAEAKSGSAPSERMSKQTRLEIIRDFETQIVYARTAFPMGAKGLRLKDGVITPGREELQQHMALFGPAVKVGDPAHISYVQIKDDHIRFEINGGPVHRKKWYQHIQIQGANGGGPIGPSREPQKNP